MDGRDNTSEEATSARGTKSASDLESKVEVPEHDVAWPMPINAAWRPMPPPHAAAAARPPYVSVISRGTTKDRHPRDCPRDTPTELPVEDPRGSINPHEVSTLPTIKRTVHLNVGTKESYREAGNTERAAVHGVDDIKENSLVATVGTEKVSAPEAEARGASGSTTNRSLRLLL
ncbi:hypothetical protein B296_00007866 [Ensete ventricosum]|uniref:Uncharacterized protein n=1 Tax=Ensete ventricosum TaxID=4639 RepID=A0A427B4L8_ENSVE|nr:hypothetical protein B296_00007866 [Ensete ventricosum]